MRSLVNKPLTSTWFYGIMVVWLDDGRLARFKSNGGSIMSDDVKKLIEDLDTVAKVALCEKLVGYMMSRDVRDMCSLIVRAMGNAKYGNDEDAWPIRDHTSVEFDEAMEGLISNLIEALMANFTVVEVSGTQTQSELESLLASVPDPGITKF